MSNLAPPSPTPASVALPPSPAPVPSSPLDPPKTPTQKLDVPPTLRSPPPSPSKRPRQVTETTDLALGKSDPKVPRLLTDESGSSSTSMSIPSKVIKNASEAQKDDEDGQADGAKDGGEVVSDAAQSGFGRASDGSAIEAGLPEGSGGGEIAEGAAQGAGNVGDDRDAGSAEDAPNEDDKDEVASGVDGGPDDATVDPAPSTPDGEIVAEVVVEEAEDGQVAEEGNVQDEEEMVVITLMTTKLSNQHGFIQICDRLAGGIGNIGRTMWRNGNRYRNILIQASLVQHGAGPVHDQNVVVFSRYLSKLSFQHLEVSSRLLRILKDNLIDPGTGLVRNKHFFDFGALPILDLDYLILATTSASTIQQYSKSSRATIFTLNTAWTDQETAVSLHQLPTLLRDLLLGSIKAEEVTCWSITGGNMQSTLLEDGRVFVRRMGSLLAATPMIVNALEAAEPDMTPELIQKLRSIVTEQHRDHGSKLSLLALKMRHHLSPLHKIYLISPPVSSAYTIDFQYAALLEASQICGDIGLPAALQAIHQAYNRTNFIITTLAAQAAHVMIEVAPPGEAGGQMLPAASFFPAGVPLKPLTTGFPSMRDIVPEFHPNGSVKLRPLVQWSRKVAEWQGPVEIE